MKKSISLIHSSCLNLTIIICLLGTILFVHKAKAQSTIGSEFSANTYTANDQNETEVAMDRDGNYIIVWESDVQDGSGFGIYAQRYNASGARIGSEFRANTYTSNDQDEPSVAMDSYGNFVITWESNGQDGSNYGVYAQQFNAVGIPQGSEFKVNTYTTNYQGYPSIAMDSIGDFVITWLSNTQDGSSYGIYAQRYNAYGVAQGTEFRVNTYTTGNQDFPSIAMDTNGDFVISWESEDQDGSSFGVYAQRYNAAGAPQGTEFQVNTFTYDSQGVPSIAMDLDGNFVIAWESWDQDGDGSGSGVFAQRYNASGLALGSEFQVNTYTDQDQRSPSVTMDSDGDFIVAWESWFQDGDASGIYVQRFNSQGFPQGTELQVNTYTTGMQYAPAIASDSTGAFVIAWASESQDGDGDGVYGQQYSAPPPNTEPVISAQSFSIAENSANGTAIGTVVASDPDAGQTLVYTIFSGNTGNLFSINSTTGALKVAGTIDYETTSSYSLTVQIMDNGSPAKNNSAVITININDVNEAPVIANQNFSIAENTSSGTSVGTVLASDVDAGQTLTYAITSGNAANTFSINSSTGEITVAGTLDYETYSLYSLTVKVTDNGSPAKNSNATIKITILDLSEVPVIANQSFSIAENSLNGTSIGTIVASTDVGQTLTYIITSGNTGNAFALNNSTGELTVAGSLDYENIASYSLTIKVTDNHVPSGNSSATITVQIIDLTNEHSPVVTNQVFSIAENSSLGTTVGTVIASDADAGQTVSYTILSGNIGNAFSINNSTGVITVAGALNYESLSSYILSIQVTDNGSPTNSTTAGITIYITDVVETGTITSLSATEILLCPNPASGQVKIEVSGPAKIKVMNSSGQIMKEEILENNILNIEYLKAGIYLVEISQDNQKTIKKLVVE